MSPRHFALFASFCEISLPSFALWPIGRVSPSPGPRRRRGFTETAHWRNIVAQRRGCSKLCLARRPAPHPGRVCSPESRRRRVGAARGIAGANHLSPSTAAMELSDLRGPAVDEELGAVDVAAFI